MNEHVDEIARAIAEADAAGWLHKEECERIARAAMRAVVKQMRNKKLVALAYEHWLENSKEDDDEAMFDAICAMLDAYVKEAGIDE